MSSAYDKNGVTANQRLLLELIEPGLWFDPEDYTILRSIPSRISACKQLADKNILLKRPYSDLGYITFQYMLPVTKANELGIIREALENE